MLSKDLLEELYNEHRLSMAEIAERLGCSQNKVAYWMAKHGIKRRDVSEAIYQWHNPNGDPFTIHMPETEDERQLLDLGIGLYIGEGTKKNPYGVLLANTDPRVIRVFIRFLREICGVNKSDLRAQINVFDDVALEDVQRYWEEVTGLPRSQFYKPTVRPSKGGTYANKSKYGTVTISFGNTKLHQIIREWCEESLSKYS